MPEHQRNITLHHNRIKPEQYRIKTRPFRKRPHHLSRKRTRQLRIKPQSQKQQFLKQLAQRQQPLNRPPKKAANPPPECAAAAASFRHRRVRTAGYRFICISMSTSPLSIAFFSRSKKRIDFSLKASATSSPLMRTTTPSRGTFVLQRGSFSSILQNAPK